MDTEHVKLTTEMGEPEPDETGDEGHRLIDKMMRDMNEEYPDYPKETRLKWGYLWKNAAYDHHGYTPKQLVYGDAPQSRGQPPPSAKECEEEMDHYIEDLRVMRQKSTASRTLENTRKEFEEKKHAAWVRVMEKE